MKSIQLTAYGPEGTARNPLSITVEGDPKACKASAKDENAKPEISEVLELRGSSGPKNTINGCNKDATLRVIGKELAGIETVILNGRKATIDKLSTSTELLLVFEGLPAHNATINPPQETDMWNLALYESGSKLAAKVSLKVTCQ